jgi:peptidoglycan/LPS O-acetylase OafA/YrhL
MSSTPRPNSIPGNYRHDIDGLRALAIIFVITFHSGSNLFSSGFIGVDIFFVISGYLMTNIILTNLEKDKFTFYEFYARRLWRIQPALLVMVLFTTLFTFIFYLPSDLLQDVHSAKYVSLFLSNQFFAKQSAAYASPDAATFPLLHTWSLSVEWQWYLFLPLALALLYKRLPSRLLPLVTGGLTVVAVIGSLTISRLHINGSYYFLLTRIFEFLFGSMAVFLGRRRYRPSAYMATIAGFLALAMLFYVAAHKTELVEYPDQYALITVISAAILIYLGVFSNELPTRLLGMKPLAYIGKISYSLYLWHWPVFALGRYLDYQETEAASFRLACLLITLILSILSYYLVENPLRKKRITLKRTFSLLVGLPIILLLTINGISTKYDGLPQRFGSEYYQTVHKQNIYEKMALNRAKCLDTRQRPDICSFGDQHAQKTALMIGDSNSNHFWGFFDVMAKDAHIKFTALSTPSCLTLPNIFQFDWWIFRNIPYSLCHDNTEKYYNLIKQNRYNYVIIGEIWEQYSSGPHLINKEGDQRSNELSHQRMEKSLRQGLDLITSSGATPIFIKTIAPMPHGYMECVNKHILFREKYDKNQCDNSKTSGTDDPWVLGLFEKLKIEYPTLEIIDPKSIQCHSGECITAIGKIGIYRDVGHLTDYASYTFGEEYLKLFGNPFLAVKN